MPRLLALLVLASTPALAGQRVVGGTQAAPGAWPDAAAIKLQGSWGCTGTLVAPRVVLTAGHCNTNITDVLLDSVDYADGSQGEQIPVIATYEYPDSWNNYDVTVLVLERDATVAPRTVATSCVIDNHLYDGAPVAVVGFGSTSLSGWGGNSKLNEAFTRVDDDDCSASDRGCNRSVQTEGELIAGGDGIDSCNGDSGGPLYLQTPDGDYLVGITSRAAYPLDNNCGDGGIYVRADAIIDWAEEQTGLAIQRPDCDTVSPPVNRPPIPTASPIDIEAGATGTTTVAPNDPDAAQTHSFALAGAPTQGSASVDTAGRVTYTAPADFTGSLTFTVEVTDDGDPVETGTATIVVTVREPVGGEDSGLTDTDSGDPSAEDSGEVRLERGGCSCATPGAPAPWLALALPLLALRRRRIDARS